MLWPVWVLLFAGYAQGIETLTIPSVTMLNSSTIFSLSSLSLPSTYKLSLSVCSSSGNLAHVSFEGSNSSATYSSDVHSGVAQLELGADSDSGAQVNVTLDNGMSAWLGVVEVDDPSSPGVLESMDVPLFYTSDSDNVTAVFFSPTYYPSIGTSPSYTPLLIPSHSLDPPQSALLTSPCYVASLLSSTSQNITTSESNQGIISFTLSQGGRGNITNTDGVRFKYLANDLAPNTNYTLVGLEQLSSSLNNSYRVWGAQHFTTKTDTTCRLLHNLDFCPNVAYSVPSPPSMPDDILIQTYKDIIQPNIDQFNTTLSTFPCGLGAQGDYSPVQSCDTCLTAYTTWLCGVVMPRCEDVQFTTRLSSSPPPSLENNTNTAPFEGIEPNENSNNNNEQLKRRVFDKMFVEESQQISFTQNKNPNPNHPSSATVVRTDPSISRTPFFSQQALANLTSSNSSLIPLNLASPFPYTEILPCSSTCHQVAAACPPLMAWTCPVDATIASSYGRFFPVGPGDVQGGDSAGSQYKGGVRSSNRWGDVYCNALFTDRIFSIRGSSLLSLPLPSFSCYLAPILVLSSFHLYPFL